MANTQLSNMAFKRFCQTIGEAKNLLKIAEQIEGQKVRENVSLFSPASEHICRLAIIYGVAAMDSYFTSKFAGHFAYFLKSTEKLDSATETLEEAGINSEFLLDIIRGGVVRPFRVIGTKLREEKGKSTHQRPEKIDQLFALYGLNNLSKNAMNKAQKGESTPKRVKIPLERLEEIVDRRNQIAHACDIHGHNRFTEISLEDTRRNLDIIHAFVSAAEEIINNKMSPPKRNSKNK